MSDAPPQAGTTAEGTTPGGSAGRPPTVEPAAVWSEETGEWELHGKDEQGRPHGLARSWRGDGTLASEGDYRDGLRQGVHRRFHPDGTIAREGSYVDGVPQGEVVAWASDAPTTERLQSCCVPPGAWQRRMEFDRGEPVGDRWFDRGGVQILPSGRPYPPRPGSVPPRASYEEESELWVEVGAGIDPIDGRATQVWRRWSVEGVLRERTEAAGAERHGLWQSFDLTGAIREETTYRDGRREGPYRRIGVPAGTYRNDRVHEERGQHAGDQVVGIWTLHDEDGEVVRRFDFGPPLDEEGVRRWLADLISAPAPSRRTELDATLERELGSFERQGRVAEGLLAAACLAGLRGDPDLLRLRLAERTPSLSSAAAEELASRAVDGAAGRLVPLVNALLQGGAPAPLLRAISSAFSGAERVSLALVDAALAIAPERAELWSSRALVNVYLGRPSVARADLSQLPPDWVEQRAFLDAYVRIVFPRFDFWPGRAEIRTGHTDLPEAPDQPLEAIRTAIQKYATRIGHLRAAILACLEAQGGRSADVDWLPPDLGFILPDGPSPLETWEFEETVLDDSASEGAAAAPTRVRVDERLALGEAPTIPALMRVARAEWNALTWLCWSAGLDRVALPETLNPSPRFGEALGMFVERVWRCRDKVTTSGLRALTQGIPGFVWEGIEIDLLPQVLVDIATDEHVEARALFYWLADAGVQSPWQNNLRLPD